MSTHDGQTPADTITSLRADLEAISALVEAATGHRATLAEGIAAARRDRDATSAALASLEAAVAELTPDPAHEGDTPAPDDAPGEPDGDEPSAWVDYAGAEDWVELADWVDWLMVTYDFDEPRRVLTCWPAHLGVVEELAALRSSWRDAALAAAAGAGDALAVWHTTHLSPVLGRLNTQYGTRACNSTRHAPIMRPPLADRTLIDVRSAVATRDRS